MPVQSLSCVGLLPRLRKLLEDEERVFGWKLANTCSGWKERCQVVSWLWWINKKLENDVEILALAVEILDRFLGSVKVQWKYMKCVALASYHLALTLLMEDDEDVPSMKTLIDRGNCSFGSKDATRMENIIKSKLDSDLKTPTAYDFLDVIALLFGSEHDEIMKVNELQTDATFQDLCNLLQLCLCASKFSRYKNSTLAVSVISVIVAKYIPDWFTVLAPVLHLTKTTTVDVLQCRELVKNVALIRKHPKSRRKPNVSKCPTLSPIIESPFESEFSMHCEREALKDIKNSTSVNSKSPKTPKSLAEKTTSRCQQEADDFFPAAKRPRIRVSGMENV